jgi:hypothetical protein
MDWLSMVRAAASDRFTGAVDWSSAVRISAFDRLASAFDWFTSAVNWFSVVAKAAASDWLAGSAAMARVTAQACVQDGIQSDGTSTTTVRASNHLDFNDMLALAQFKAAMTPGVGFKGDIRVGGLHFASISTLQGSPTKVLAIV